MQICLGRPNAALYPFYHLHTLDMVWNLMVERVLGSKIIFV